MTNMYMVRRVRERESNLKIYNESSARNMKKFRQVICNVNERKEMREVEKS